MLSIESRITVINDGYNQYYFLVCSKTSSFSKFQIFKKKVPQTKLGKFFTYLDEKKKKYSNQKKKKNKSKLQKATILCTYNYFFTNKNDKRFEPKILLFLLLNKI